MLNWLLWIVVIGNDCDCDWCMFFVVFGGDVCYDVWFVMCCCVLCEWYVLNVKIGFVLGFVK